MTVSVELRVIIKKPTKRDHAVKHANCQFSLIFFPENRDCPNELDVLSYMYFNEKQCQEKHLKNTLFYIV